MPIEEIQLEITKLLNEAHNRLTQGNITLEDAIEINKIINNAAFLLFSDTILSKIQYDEETTKDIKSTLLVQVEMYISLFLMLYIPLIPLIGVIDGFRRFKNLKNKKDTSNLASLTELKYTIDLRRDLLGSKILLLANGNAPLNMSEEEKESLIPHAIEACNILSEYQPEDIPVIANEAPDELKNILNSLMNNDGIKLKRIK